MLDGFNPNNSTISWAEFLQHIAWANQTAHKVVNAELSYIPGEENDTDDDPTLRPTRGLIGGSIAR